MIKRELLVTEDGSHTIFLPELDETYHSVHGAIQESVHVFIENGLRYFYQKERKNDIRIFEVGFGTGLNALLAAIFSEENDISVDYESIEAFPLRREEAESLNYSEKLSSSTARKIYRNIHAGKWEETIRVSPNFLLKKVEQDIRSYTTDKIFDICFFDAFAPSKQAEMWEKAILEEMWAMLEKGGIFVTYCAKGQLKRDLKSIGFEVQTLPGPPGKLQMVRGIKI